MVATWPAASFSFRRFGRMFTSGPPRRRECPHRRADSTTWGQGGRVFGRETILHAGCRIPPVLVYGHPTARRAAPVAPNVQGGHHEELAISRRGPDPRRPRPPPPPTP